MNADIISLPYNFLNSSHTAYRILLYKFLLEETSRSDKREYELDYIAARMVFEAWPILMEYGLSLGVSDKLLFVCMHIKQRGLLEDKPSLQFIEECLLSSLYRPYLNDVKKALYEFMSGWVGPMAQPYTIDRTQVGLAIRINDEWVKAFFSAEVDYKGLYYESMMNYLGKKNKNLIGVSDYLKKNLDTFACPSLEKFTTRSDVVHSPKYIDALPTHGFERLKKIPIGFLYEEKKMLGCVRQVFGWEKMCPHDVSVVADLFFEHQPKNQLVLLLRDFVRKETKKIIDLFDYYEDKPEIPSVFLDESNLGLATQLFVKEYIDRIAYKLSLMNRKEANPKKKRLDIFASFYGMKSESYETQASVAEEYGLSRERVRQLLRGDDEVGLKACSQILKGGFQTRNFQPNLSFQRSIMLLECGDDCGFPLAFFDEKYGILDEKSRSFLLDVINWKICRSMPAYIGPVVCRECDTKKMAHVFSNLRNFLDERFFPVSLENEIVPQLMKYGIEDKQTLDVVCDIVRKSDSFERTHSDDGEELFSLKWQYLCTVPSRLARILIEAGKPMHRNDVYAEYYRRAELYGIRFEKDIDKHTKRSHPFIQSVGKKGMWMFSTDELPKESLSMDVSAEIETYIKKKGGIVSVEEMFEHLRSSGYTNTESTINVYLSKLCRRNRTASGSVLVYKPWIKRFDNLNLRAERNSVCKEALQIFVEALKRNEAPSSVSDLRTVFFEKTGKQISDGHARTLIGRHPELFEKTRIDANMVLISLNTGQKKETDSLPTYRDVVRKKIEEVLKETPGHCLRMNLVARSVKDCVPRDRYKNIIYRIIDNMTNVQKYTVSGKKFLRLIEP